MWQPLTERGEPHITVCWEIDANRWKELLYKTMRVNIVICFRKPLTATGRTFPRSYGYRGERA